MGSEVDSMLGAGRYYGQVLKQRRSNGFVFTELKHSKALALPRHAHECGYFSLLVDGRYREWYGRRAIGHIKYMSMWHPSDLIHNDEVGEGGCRLFSVEVSAGALDLLRMKSRVLSEPAVLQSSNTSRILLNLLDGLRDGFDGDLIVDGLSLELLDSISQDGAYQDKAKPKWLRRIENLIREQYDRKLTMAEFSLETGIHPVHIAAVFRRFHNTTIGEHIHFLRIQDACNYLCGNELQLAEIALRLGYSDQSHFTRTFRKIKGISPGEWRLARRQASGRRDSDHGNKSASF